MAPPEESSEHEEPKAEDAMVTIAKLKTVRTNLKTKITCVSGRLCSAIDKKQDCNDILFELKALMSAFNTAHEDFCNFIEIHDLDDHKVVNGLDPVQYQNGVDETYRDAIDKHQKFVLSLEVTKCKQQISIQSKRLTGTCESLEKMLSDDSKCDVDSLWPYKDTVEQLVECLLRLISDLSIMDSSCTNIQDEVTELIVRADDVKMKCEVRINTVRSHPLHQRVFVTDRVNPQSQVDAGTTTSISYVRHPSELCNDLSAVPETGDMRVDSNVKAPVGLEKFQGLSNPVPSKHITVQIGGDNSDAVQYKQSQPGQTSFLSSSKLSSNVYLKKTPLPEFSGQCKKTGLSSRQSGVRWLNLPSNVLKH